MFTAAPLKGGLLEARDARRVVKALNRTARRHAQQPERNECTCDCGCSMPTDGGMRCRACLRGRHTAGR